MRPKLKVHCYKESGKLAYTNKLEESDDYPELDGHLYPTLIDSFGKQPSRTELWEMQEVALVKLEEMIRSNDKSVLHLSPENFGFNNNYIYVIEVLFQPETHYKGFLNFILTK